MGNSTRHGWLGTSNTINPNEAEWFPNKVRHTAAQPYSALYGWTQGLDYYCNCTNPQYNSFQSTVTIKSWSGWTVQGNYTYQRLKTWDGPYDTNYYFIYGPQNGAGGYGDSSLIPHHQITIAQNYDVPFGHGKKFGSSVNKGVDAVLGGWTISLITTFYSGLPVLANSGELRLGSASQVQAPTIAPIREAGVCIHRLRTATNGSTGCPNQQCTSGPYMYPGEFHFGNYPIDTVDRSAFHQLRLHGAESSSTSRSAFRSDSAWIRRNFFNHTNLNGPNTDVQSPNVGQITSIAFGGNNGVGMRTLQFSANIKF